MFLELPMDDFLLTPKKVFQMYEMFETRTRPCCRGYQPRTELNIARSQNYKYRRERSLGAHSGSPLVLLWSWPRTERN